MKTFNLTSYASGRIVKTITATSMDDAKNQLEAKGYDCQDDYFLMTVEDATENFKKSIRYAGIENIMQQAEQDDADYLLFNYKN
jgi:hypothetical protein